MSNGITPQSTKLALLAECKQYVNQRIENAKQAIAATSDAAAADTKSSAGDKFETTREMMQQELNRHRQLLADAERMEQALDKLDIRVLAGPAKRGSLIETDRGTFFLAIGIGQLRIAGISYWVISPASPLGQRFMGRKPGEQVTFNNTEYGISEVW